MKFRTREGERGMKILQTKIYEESKVMIKLGEDFKRCQLDDFYGTGAFSLNSEMLTFNREF